MERALQHNFMNRISKTRNATVLYDPELPCQCEVGLLVIVEAHVRKRAVSS